METATWWCYMFLSDKWVTVQVKVKVIIILPSGFCTWGSDLLLGCRWTAASCRGPCRHRGSHATCICSGRTASSLHPTRGDKHQQLKHQKKHIVGMWSSLNLKRNSVNRRISEETISFFQSLRPRRACDHRWVLESKSTVLELHPSAQAKEVTS